MANYSELQSKIQNALERFETMKKIQGHLEGIESEISTCKSKMKEWEKILDDELKDIQSLESMGMKSVFHKVLGNKEEQLEKERQEFLEASLKYNELKKSLELLEYEKSVLQGKMEDQSYVEKELDRLKELREIEILKNNEASASELREISFKLDKCVSLNKELLEAIEEGEKADKILSVVLSYLKKARDWGRWDMQGSRKGDRRKHQAIDSAMKNLAKAQHQLNVFERELNDLGISHLHLKIRASQFDRFTDFFFDNLISDWIVQQKIKGTIGSIESSLGHVKRLSLSLEKEKSTNLDHMKKLEAEKDKILLS